jgi:hypothetical protein
MQLEGDRGVAVAPPHALSQARAPLGDDGHLRHGEDAVQQDEEEDGQ